jgi:hypothetical protein
VTDAVAAELGVQPARMSDSSRVQVAADLAQADFWDLVLSGDPKGW